MRCQTMTFFFVIFSPFIRPRARLATVLSRFFGLATNTLKVRNNTVFFLYIFQLSKIKTCFIVKVNYFTNYLSKKRFVTKNYE